MTKPKLLKFFKYSFYYIADLIVGGNSGTPLIAIKGNTTIAYGLYSLGPQTNKSLPSIVVDLRSQLEWIFGNV
jgi:hypothetical protein